MSVSLCHSKIFEFWEKSKREVPLFLEIPEFPFNAVHTRPMEACVKNKLNPFGHLDTIPTCHRHTQTSADAVSDTSP